jgi:hypothetical protein
MTFVNEEEHTEGRERTTNEVQKDFYCHLAAELIDNNFEKVVGSRKTQNDSSPSSSEGGTHRESLFHKHDGAPRCGIAAHLTPTKRKRKNQKGEIQNRNLQGRCRVCSMKTIYTCSLCVDD